METVNLFLCCFSVIVFGNVKCLGQFCSQVFAQFLFSVFCTNDS